MKVVAQSDKKQPVNRDDDFECDASERMIAGQRDAVARAVTP